MWFFNFISLCICALRCMIHANLYLPLSELLMNLFLRKYSTAWQLSISMQRLLCCGRTYLDFLFFFKLNKEPLLSHYIPTYSLFEKKIVHDHEQRLFLNNSISFLILSFFFLKISKSRKQFMVSWILPKKRTKLTILSKEDVQDSFRDLLTFRLLNSYFPFRYLSIYLSIYFLNFFTIIIIYLSFILFYFLLLFSPVPFS